jgi:uncharacterized membrane protein YbaN (DUF454 family)
LNNSENKLYKWALISLGTLSVGVGILGIFLPLLPTTVFFLIAAWAYSKSSKRFYNWLITNKYFGQYIKNYREKKGIPLKIKIRSIILLWLTILISVFLLNNLWVRILLIIIAISVSIHIWLLKTYREESE